MSRIENCFASLSEKNRKALIPYVTAGDSSKDVTVPLMHAMVEAGADIIELGCRSPTPWRMVRSSSRPVNEPWSMAPPPVMC